MPPNRTDVQLLQELSSIRWALELFADWIEQKKTCKASVSWNCGGITGILAPEVYLPPKEKEVERKPKCGTS